MLFIHNDFALINYRDISKIKDLWGKKIFVGYLLFKLKSFEESIERNACATHNASRANYSNQLLSLIAVTIKRGANVFVIRMPTFLIKESFL